MARVATFSLHFVAGRPIWPPSRHCDATEGLAPQLTLLLDIEPELGLARAGRRAEGGAGGMAAIGGDSLEFHRRVREGFLALAGKDRERIALISGILPPSAVVHTAWERVRGLLERHL